MGRRKSLSNVEGFRVGLLWNKGSKFKIKKNGYAKVPLQLGGIRVEPLNL
jgi:hypothetical protein